MLSGTGICLDYAAVMASMLRSQNIPTRLEVGYAGNAYHAWISTYITDVGWVNGVIEFNGTSWSLMDPSFAANSSDTTLKNFDFWSGAKDTVKYLTESELDTIESYLEELYPEGMTDTELNDFMWFEDDTIAEWLGYNDFDEIMNRSEKEE